MPQGRGAKKGRGKQYIEKKVPPLAYQRIECDLKTHTPPCWHCSRCEVSVEGPGNHDCPKASVVLRPVGR